jgi:hypothetical protein
MMQAGQILVGHRSAALYDFRSRLQSSPEAFPPSERILLAVEMVKDHTSRLGAALRGWLYAPTDAEFAEWLALDFENQRNTSKKDRAKWKPAARPWEPSSSKRAPVMKPETRDRLRAHARRMAPGTND